MLITCNGCKKKIKVPDAAAGKRVKCPTCATVLRVPELPKPDAAPPEDPPEPKDEPAGTEVSEKPTKFPIKKKAVPKKTMMGRPPEDDEDDDSKSAIQSKKSKASADDDEDDEPAPKKKSRATDDDEQDDDRPSKRKRKQYDDDDDDDVSIRRKRRDRDAGPQGANGMAITSMVMGIIAVIVGLPGCLGCCCGIFTAIAFVCAIVAVICGHMSIKTPGSEGMAMTGLICGYIAIALSVIGVVMVVLAIFFNIGIQGMNAAGGGFNPPPPRRF